MKIMIASCLRKFTWQPGRIVLCWTTALLLAFVRSVVQCGWLIVDPPSMDAMDEGLCLKAVKTLR